MVDTIFLPISCTSPSTVAITMVMPGWGFAAGIWAVASAMARLAALADCMSCGRKIFPLSVTRANLGEGGDDMIFDHRKRLFPLREQRGSSGAAAGASIPSTISASSDPVSVLTSDLGADACATVCKVSSEYFWI